MRDIFILYRKAQSDIADITNSKLPTDINEDVYYDLIAPNGKRIDIKATVAKGKTGRARFSLNAHRNGLSIKKRIDYLVCVAYDSNNKIQLLLAIPSKHLPDWETSFGVSINPQKRRIANSWMKYQVTTKELEEIFKRKEQ